MYCTFLYQGRNYHWTEVDKVQGAPECKGAPEYVQDTFFSKAQYFIAVQNPKFTLQRDMNSPAGALPVNLCAAVTAVYND